MKNSKIKTVGILLIAVLLSANTSLLAQRGGGWGQNSNYGRVFNPETVKTITGTIVDIERILPNKKMSYGLHLKVKTEKETISVHLGPTWYLDNQEIQFVKGEQITVTGSKVMYQNAPAVIAIAIVQNEYALKLRDKNGYPVWSGWRKRGMQKGRNRG